MYESLVCICVYICVVTVMCVQVLYIDIENIIIIFQHTCTFLLQHNIVNTNILIAEYQVRKTLTAV